MSTNKKIWYASSNRPYLGGEEWFYNTNKLPWVSEIEKKWHEHKGEIIAYIKEKDTKFSSSGFYKDIDAQHGWTVISFLFWGLKISGEFDIACPKLSADIKKVPGVVSVSLSQLAPNSILAEHSGDTNAIMRCHLGVEIPAALPECGFKVNDETRSWANGKFLIFNDAYRHSAWNNTNKRRILVIIDVIRPEFLGKKNLISAFILTRHVTYLYDRIKLIKNAPVYIKTILFAFILGIIYLLKPIYNLSK